MKSFGILACALLALTTILMSGDYDLPPGDFSGRLVITGSSTVAPLVNEIAKRFESLHPGVRIDVQTGGSSRGIADTRRGVANIGMTSRSLKTEESDLAAHTIALDGISLILHRHNPLTVLTPKQIVDIFTGKITQWAQVGGVQAPITVVNKAEGRSTLELFLEHFNLRNTDIQPHVVIGDNQQGILTVSGDPNAIGYVSIGTALYEVERGTPIKLLDLEGITPTLGNVRNGAFPLSRPLNLVTRGELSILARAFIDFALSEDVNDLIEAQYFVPLAH
jgi:phosphate transport system substrate-binding protein